MKLKQFKGDFSIVTKGEMDRITVHTCSQLLLTTFRALCRRIQHKAGTGINK